MSDAATVPVRKDTLARYLGGGVLGMYVLILAIGLLFWQSESTRGLLSGPVLLSASLAATVVCAAAWRALAGPDRRIWLLFGISAALATLSHIAEAAPGAASRLTAIHALWLSSYGMLLSAVVIAVHNRERGRRTELALDLALVLTAATVVVVRWAPGARFALDTNSIGILALLIFGPVVALTASLFVAVLVTSEREPRYSPKMLAMAGAIGCFFITSMPQIISGKPCCHAGSPTTLAAIGTWAFVAFGAASAWITRDNEPLWEARERLRQFVAPTVALVLAAISLHAAIGGPLGRHTALALGVLGALVALRLTELLNATRLQVSERRELAQTRALVEVSRALAGKNDLDSTLRIVTKWAVRVLNARAASVELLSNDATMLVLRASEGLPEEAVGMKFPVESSYSGWVIINGEARVTTNAARDPFLTPESLKLLGDSPLAAMPLRYRERLLGVLTCIGSRPFDAEDLDLLRAFANQTALALEDARLFEQVRALSVTDPLTGLANRRQLERELTREFAAAQRGRRLVAVMFDLDDFKQHNDKYGHVAGDDALRHFAEALQSTMRTMNFAARYGGDEFFALLADAETKGAEVFITRVKDRFHRSMDAAGFPTLQVSAGMAEYTDEMKTPEDLITAADRALYVAKFEADVSA